MQAQTPKIIKLKPSTTAADLVETLWQMFAEKRPTVQ
jgi:hypothetical protein